MKRKSSLLTLLIIIMFFACKNEAYIPKPYAYYRIDLPKQEYQNLTNDSPFSFEFSKHAKIEKDKAYDSQKYWINIVYPTLNAKIHLSYKDVTNNFEAYNEDSHKLAYKHYIKAESIDEKEYKNDKKHVYSLIYDIKGNTASSIQFLVTDSTKHFLRGSLYFNCRPNKDSLAPLINYIHKDIEHLVESFKWKDKR